MSLESVIKDFNKQWKSEIITVGVNFENVKRISFGSPRLDYMTYGGLPRGFLVEFFGGEGGGKTTAAICACAEAQKLFYKEWDEEIKELKALNKPTKEQTSRLNFLEARGPLVVAYADCENTFDEDWARLNGMDTEHTIFIKPKQQSAEDIFDLLEQILLTGEVGLMVIDSIGVMVSSQEMEKSAAERTVAGISGPLTRFSKKAEMYCANTGCTVIGINQLRDNLNSAYGGTTTVGGRGWKHNCLLRVEFRKGRFVDANYKEINRNSESPAGNLVEACIEKTKYCKPNRRLGSYIISYSKGIDRTYDYIQLGLKYGLINQGGAWFTFTDVDTGELLCDESGTEYKVQGQGNLGTFLENTPEVFNKIIEGINRAILQ